MKKAALRRAAFALAGLVALHLPHRAGAQLDPRPYSTTTLGTTGLFEISAPNSLPARVYAIGLHDTLGYAPLHAQERDDGSGSTSWSSQRTELILSVGLGLSDRTETSVSLVSSFVRSSETLFIATTGPADVSTAGAFSGASSLRLGVKHRLTRPDERISLAWMVSANAPLEPTHEGPRMVHAGWSAGGVLNIPLRDWDLSAQTEYRATGTEFLGDSVQDLHFALGTRLRMPVLELIAEMHALVSLGANPYGTLYRFTPGVRIQLLGCECFVLDVAPRLDVGSGSVGAARHPLGFLIGISARPADLVRRAEP
jgi:hypothetical protein